MQHQWYIARDGKQYGPITSGELAQLEQTGDLKQEDYVWRAGFSDWRPLSSLSASERKDPQTPTPGAQQQADAQQQTTGQQTADKPIAAQQAGPGQVKEQAPLAAKAQAKLEPTPAASPEPHDQAVQEQTSLKNEPKELTPTAASATSSDNPNLAAAKPVKKRSFLKIAVWSLAAVLILGIAAIFAAPYLIPQEDLKHQIVKQLRAHTGRNVDIKGKLSFSIFPNIGIDIHDILIHNPPSIKQGYFARIARAHAKVKLLPLLSKKVEVNELTIHRPTVNFITASNGKNNWQLGALRPFTFKPFKVADISTSQIAKKLKELEEGADNTKTPAKAPSKTGNKKPRAPQSPIKSKGTASMPLQDLKLDQVKVEKGTVSFINQATRQKQTLSNVAFVAQADSLTSPASIKGTAVYNQKKIAVSSRFDQLLSLIEGKPTTVKANISAPEMTTNIFGKLSTAKRFELKGQLNAKASSLHKFANWLSVDLPPQRFNKGAILSQLTYRDKIITLTDATINLDKQTIKGTLSTNLNQSKPYITGKLTANRLDITPYLVSSYNILTAPIYASRATNSPQRAVAAWSSDRMNFQGLKAFNSKLSLASKELVYKNIKLSDATLFTNLTNGKLTAHLKKFKAFGGSGSSFLVLNSALSTPTILAKGTLNQLDIKPFMAAFQDTQSLSGRGSLTFNLFTKGQNQSMLASQLAGEGRLSLKDGEIQGINLAALSKALRRGSISNLEDMSSQVTKFSSLDGSFTIKDGVLTNNDLALVGPDLKVTGAGTVDIGKETIAYQVKPDLSGGSATVNALNVPLTIKGPWAKPSYGLDLNAALTDPKAIGTITKKTKDVTKKIKKLKKKKISKDDIKKLLDGGSSGTSDILGQILGGN